MVGHDAYAFWTRWVGLRALNGTNRGKGLLGHDGDAFGHKGYAFGL
jgi:hypothetical protein